MKQKRFLSMLCLALTGLLGTSAAAAACPSLLNHEVQRLTGGRESLCRYQGQVVLVVNTASRCGFTPQFEGLQKIYRQYRARGFVVLGFPSDDFRQELAKAEDVARFCQVNYGVEFPMYAIGPVKGPQANPLHQALARMTGEAPQWNFHKYLIARDGKTVLSMPSRVEPDSRELRARIEAMLEARP